MENQKSTGKTVVIVLLVIALLASCGYIGYDKFIKIEKNTTTKENQEEKTTAQELDINNRLVQSLYREVGSDNEYMPYWMYNGDEINQNKIDIQAMPEVNKMELVYENIRQSDIDSISCYSVPEKSEVGQCNQERGTSTISREVVEETYRKLYGPDTQLDLSTIMYTDVHGVGRYSYVESLDAYVLYSIEGGGTSATTYQKELTKAEEIGNQIKIYEKLTITSLDTTQQVTTETYIYTFEQDIDKMYTYITRERA